MKLSGLHSYGIKKEKIPLTHITFLPPTHLKGLIKNNLNSHKI